MEKSVSYEYFLQCLDELAGLEEFDRAKRLLQEYPEYTRRYSRELDEILEAAERSERFGNIDTAYFYRRLIEKVQSEMWKK